MADFAARRVVTGFAADGNPAFLSDGAPPETVASPMGHGLSEMLWLQAPAAAATDGGDPPAGARGMFPPRGAMAGRIIRFPGYPAGTPVDDTWLRVPDEDPALPGWHRSETLDLMMIIEGDLILGLDDGEYPLGAGAAVIQRGTSHRWRVVGDQPCTFLSVLIGPDPAAGPPVPQVIAPESAPRDSDPDARPLLLVTGTDTGGRSRCVALGAPGLQILPSTPGGTALHDFWHTGGPLGNVAQGGDAPAPWELEPTGRGITFRQVNFGVDSSAGEPFLHTTETIDIDVVIDGALQMRLGADGPATTLNKGDVLIQRATPHSWRSVGETPAILVSVMIGLPSA
ncbi:MAG TPA: cupin domain-containing protein [Frankiaceae bacterium]|jgi:quercetin dioxygenase-like cupin family protein|nr:cupin domain-containing protein [Frankiaceae bacterium]